MIQGEVLRCAEHEGQWGILLPACHFRVAGADYDALLAHAVPRAHTAAFPPGGTARSGGTPLIEAAASVPLSVFLRAIYSLGHICVQEERVWK